MAECRCHSQDEPLNVQDTMSAYPNSFARRLCRQSRTHPQFWSRIASSMGLLGVLLIAQAGGHNSFAADTPSSTLIRAEAAHQRREFSEAERLALAAAAEARKGVPPD